MNGLNGIIIDGAVYELSVNTNPEECERCALNKDNRCNAPHWLDCNCIVLHFSPELTDKLNNK